MRGTCISDGRWNEAQPRVQSSGREAAVGSAASSGAAVLGEVGSDGGAIGEVRTRPHAQGVQGCSRHPSGEAGSESGSGEQQRTFCTLLNPPGWSKSCAERCLTTLAAGPLRRAHVRAAAPRRSLSFSIFSNHLQATSRAWKLNGFPSHPVTST